MTGRHKFSDLEAAMPPTRRARVDRLAARLATEINIASGGADLSRLRELADQFTTLWTDLQGLYLDAAAGFALVHGHIKMRQAQARQLFAGTELDSEEFQDTRPFTYSKIFSDGFWTAGIHEFTQAAGIFPTQGQVKSRNTTNGTNFVLLGQLCIVAFCDFWNDYLRREYVIAKGLLDPNEKNSNIIKEVLRTHANHDLWGDLYYLRTSIVHKQGIANSNVKKCKLITWFKPGDPLSITPLQMKAIFLALLKYRNELFFEQFPPFQGRIREYGSAGPGSD